MTNDSSLSPDLRAILDSVPDTGTVVTESDPFSAADVELEGFLARPDTLGETENGPALKRPGVLVLHDWNGMTDHVKVRAQMLARLGYVAYAGDIYGVDAQPSGPDEAAQTAGAFYGDNALFRSRIEANLERLRSDPQVDTSKIVVMGYCFGGSASIEAVRAGDELAGAVSFHGGLSTGAPAQPGAVKTPLLVLTGADDPVVPPTDIADFEDELRTGGATDYQIVSYSGALHAFAVPGTNSPEHGAAFQETANRRSWKAMTDFLDEVFA